MPIDLTDYEVKTPDGQTVTFRGPSSMTDDQVKTRAQQEAAFKSGKIPTTFAGGARQSAGATLADQSKLAGAGVGLAGVLTAQPEVVAAAPMIGRALQAGGEALAGRPLTPTSTAEMATLAGEGAVAGYGPQVVSQGLESLAGKTLAHQAASGQWVAGVKGHGVIPWAIRTCGEDAKTAADALHASSKAIAALPAVQAITQSGPAIQDDVATLMTAIRSGANPAQTAAAISKGDPKKFGALMTAYMQARQVK
jgi:hypothetical protein